ncbi:MAG TPA: F0F1 ATP synthase subunit delta [Spongiibacteraceae bacterium]|nr:F0F1 ATP synthase subunit delta [Spongiibacteraceae bacterium]HCS27150.1 F0F1 ATP synthase subunit delta [Spongiibacteraceae bacterium]|tara:strand:+ start:2041 stop:2577 length:537 start_codon:yes stop_codon:yes gene_type:complete
MAELSTLARPYAKAAFEYALAAGDLAGWSDQLATAAAVAQQDVMEKVLASPSMTSSQQAQAFIDVCGDALNDKAQNFIKVLAENKRLALLAEISAIYEAHKAAQEKSVDVELSTAFELDADTQQKLAAALSGKLQREVNVTAVVNKELLGGVLVRAGDLVIDGSVRGRLAKLAEAMNS